MRLILLVCLCALLMRANSARTSDVFKVSQQAIRFCEGVEQDHTQAEIALALSVADGAQLDFTANQIRQMFDSGDTSQITKKYGIMGLAGAIGFTITMLTWPVLLCFCLCPHAHPVCEKLRKPVKEDYTVFERRLSLVITCFFCLGFMMASVVGLGMGVNKVSQRGKEVMCKMMRFQDKTLYGFESGDRPDEYFSGLLYLRQDIRQVVGNFNSYFSILQRLSTYGSTIEAKKQALDTNLASIYNSYNDITYMGAFRYSNGATPFNVQSNFKSLLGSYSAYSSTILGYICTGVSQIQQQANQLKNATVDLADRLVTSGSQSVVKPLEQLLYGSNSTQQGSNGLINVAATLQFNQQQIADSFEYGSSLLEIISFILLPLLVASLVVGVVGIVVSAYLFFRSNTRLRYLLYLTCSMTAIFTIISFLLAIVAGVFYYALPQTCSYLQNDFAAGLSLLTYRYNPQYSDRVRAVLNDCRSGESGEIFRSWPIQGLYSSSANDIWNQLSIIESNLLNFEEVMASYNDSTISIITNEYLSRLQKIKTSQTLDITYSTAVNYLKEIANHSVTPVGCTAAVLSDSFVPHFSSGIPCSKGPEMQVCGDLSSFPICPFGCYEIYEEFINGDTYFYEDLPIRYGASCNYNTYLEEIHTNWNVPRAAAVNQVAGQIIQTFDGGVGIAYWDALNTFKTNLASEKSQLLTYSLTANKTGSVKGSNCRILQEPILELKNSACGRAYPLVKNLFFSLVILGCFGVGSMIGSGVAGMRQTRHEAVTKGGEGESMEGQSQQKISHREGKVQNQLRIQDI